MKTIYLDSEFRCHTTDNGTMTAVETEAFDGKCTAYIEGYRLVPAGSVWIRADGAVFRGEMLAPWKPRAELEAAQSRYELALLQEQNRQLTDQMRLKDAQIAAMSDRQEFTEELIAEMAGIIYA